MVLKVKIVMDKGTTIHDEEYKEIEWAGKSYHEEQKKKLKTIPYGTILSVRRGTGFIKASEYPIVPKKLDLKGFVISTGRGTSTRIL
jgi:hypothetical protein